MWVERCADGLSGRSLPALHDCDVRTDQYLRVQPSNHFEKLRGNLAGFHSIPISSQCRLVFRQDGGHGEAEGVYLDDHKYR